MTAPIVHVQGLSRQFGKLHALRDVSFQIQPGLVYGLVGANGAGKTTLLKHLLGLLNAESGSVDVFGHNPVEFPVQVLSRIGYLSEDRELPEWMSIDELMRMSAGYYRGWDWDYARELMATFGLQPSKKIKHLSKGMRAQAALVAAVAHHPDLLLLDEPSTGLDAVVRRDILNAIIRTVADNGRTAIFSSHLLDEVELMSDHVLMIQQGNLVLDAPLEDVCQQHHLLTVLFAEEREEMGSLVGLLSAVRRSGDWSLTVRGELSDWQQRLSAIGGTIQHARPANLQEVFVARVGRDRNPEVA